MSQLADSIRRSPRIALQSAQAAQTAQAPQTAQSSSKTSNISSKVLAEIEEALREKKNRDVDNFEMDMPSIPERSRIKVHELIHNLYSAEIIDGKLFIKVNIVFNSTLDVTEIGSKQFDGGLKAECHDKLKDSFTQQLPAWWCRTVTTCVVNGNDYLPDIGCWNPRPTFHQKVHPIRDQCPPPLVWVEVVYNTEDREVSLRKFQKIIPHCPNTEFILIVLPVLSNPIPPNPAPAAISVPVGPAAALLGRPRGPYLGYWAPGAVFGAVQWHNMPWNWNHHIALACGANLDFNIVLNVLAYV